MIDYVRFPNPNLIQPTSFFDTIIVKQYNYINNVNMLFIVEFFFYSFKKKTDIYDLELGRIKVRIYR
jgi:hypothetical protein